MINFYIFTAIPIDVQLNHGNSIHPIRTTMFLRQANCNQQCPEHYHICCWNSNILASNFWLQVSIDNCFWASYILKFGLFTVTLPGLNIYVWACPLFRFQEKGFNPQLARFVVILWIQLFMSDNWITAIFLPYMIKISNAHVSYTFVVKNIFM